MTLEEKISGIKSVAKSHRKNIHLLVDDTVILLHHLERTLKIINELQQKNDLLEMDLTAAQEIMGCMNQEKVELIKALNYIRSCDSATQSAAKAIEMLKKYENV